MQTPSSWHEDDWVSWVMSDLCFFGLCQLIRKGVKVLIPKKPRSWEFGGPKVSISEWQQCKLPLVFLKTLSDPILVSNMSCRPALEVARVWVLSKRSPHVASPPRDTSNCHALLRILFVHREGLRFEAYPGLQSLSAFSFRAGQGQKIGIPCCCKPAVAALSCIWSSGFICFDFADSKSALTSQVRCLLPGIRGRFLCHLHHGRPWHGIWWHDQQRKQGACDPCNGHLLRDIETQSWLIDIDCQVFG